MLIGLAGLIGAGKTTIGKALATRLFGYYREEYSILSFAQPIKDSLKAIGVTKEEQPELYRKMAQYIGQTCRDADPDHWIKIFKKQIFRFANLRIDQINRTKIISDDVRYPNEYDIFLQSGHLFYIHRPNSYDLINPKFDHESERLNKKILTDKEMFNRYNCFKNFHFISNDRTVNSIVDQIISTIRQPIIPIHDTDLSEG